MKSAGLVFLVLLFSVLFALQAGFSDEGSAAALYKARCAACHGEDGHPKGIAKNSAAFPDEAWKKSTSLEEVAQVISRGRSKMPAFGSKLSPEEIQALAAYVLAMKDPA